MSIDYVGRRRPSVSKSSNARFLCPSIAIDGGRQPTWSCCQYTANIACRLRSTTVDGLHRLAVDGGRRERYLRPRPHQQQYRSNIVECYKSNDSFDKVECCFDIVAVFGNNVAGFENNVERNFVLSTKWKQIEHACSICFHFVERTEFRSTLLPKPATFVRLLLRQ